MHVVPSLEGASLPPQSVHTPKPSPLLSTTPLMHLQLRPDPLGSRVCPSAAHARHWSELVSKYWVEEQVGVLVCRSKGLARAVYTTPSTGAAARSQMAAAAVAAVGKDMGLPFPLSEIFLLLGV
eukprot:scaffold104181_cov28-Tisochrysis_lutea.AAC.4